MELHDENTFKIRGYQNAIFNLDKLIKQRKVGVHLSNGVLLPLPSDKLLCVIETLNAYLKKTKRIRKTNKVDNLFLNA